MLKKIISGGQTGADIAGIDAAIAHDFPYGGWLPKGRRTIEGPLDVKYIMREMPTRGYPKRTEQNVMDSDGTVIFQQGKLSGGSDLTRKLAIKHGKPWLHLDMKKLSIDEAGEEIIGWVKKNQIETLNVAGKSASSDPEIYDIVFGVMGRVLIAT
ncbi:MAG: putative molybdenum carrier protein [Proteobacteria bacterium]|nr:putative molybdenum carrier protein [Pseudomonadota bacterium]MBU1059085.1 putative molybdenum carrier protein [Pseudomonadota bacterium]